MIGPINRVIKILIASDLFLQSGWGLIGPIFAIFLTRQIEGGSLGMVGFVAATYWLTKSVVQPFIAHNLDKNHGERDDFVFLIFGMYVANLIPLGYIFASLPWHIFALEFVRGLAMACVVPTWAAFFTRHINKGREAFSWSLESTGIGFAAGLALIGTKFLVNPFSSQGDYRVMLDPAAVFAAIRWYLLRALMIPEGIRNLPVWVMILSLIPGLILTLMFRQKLARGLGVYLLGVLPVLGFGSHLLAAYAVFGIALMVIELGRSGKFGTPRNDGIKVSVGLWVSAMAAIILLSLALVYFTYSNHWSIGRGRVSRQLTQEYIFADSDGKQEVLSRLKDFENNPEIYFSTMMGESFRTLEKLADYASKNNIKIAFNISSYLAKKGKVFLGKILKKIDILILNMEEASLLSGKRDKEKHLQGYYP